MKASFKTVLSVVLSYLMVISALPLSVIAISAVEVTLQGDGTEQSPYHIYTAEDYVYAMGSYAFDDEVYLSLDNDIEVGSINCSEFRAHLNGNFHKIDAGSILCGTNYGSIKNLNYNNYQLCSGNSSTGEIANTIVTAEISGYAMSQGLFCSGNSGKILNCAVFGKLLLDNEAGCRAAGISVTNSGTISNCYVVADIKAVGHSCYGTSHDHPICLGNYENSYYNSDISKGYNSDGLSTEFMQSQAFVDLLNKNIKTKDYLWTLDTDSQNQGYPVIKTAYNATITSSKTNLLINGTEQIELYSDDSVSVYYTLDGSEPDSSSILYNAPIEISDSVIIKAIGYKDGLTGRAVDFHYVKMRGNGTKEFPYLIDSETAFRAMSELPMNAYYEVTNNIELTESISSLDNFYGFIEGNNHTISGVFSDNRQNGIFKKNYGVIQNLNLNSDNQIFKSNGAFVYINHGVINHCSFNGTVIGYTYEGGDFDKVSYKAQKCTGLGGFVSMNYGTICDSVFTGELRADEGNTVGGFVGVNSGTINNCLFDGNVFVDDTYFDSLSYGGNYFYNFVTGFVGINTTNGSIALSTADTLVIYAISRSFSPTSVYTFCGNMDSNIDDCRCSNAKATIGGSYLEYGENLVVSQVLTGTGYTDPSHVHHCNMTMMEPTCTESGSATFICSECGTEIQSKTFAALGHNYVYVDVPSTYDEQGYYGNICSRCGDVNYITYREKLQIISGSCGENCTYYMDAGNGTMIISGSGAMTDYNASSDVPWHSFKEYIKEIQVSDEITSIGKNTFSYCDNLIEISLPNIINIGDYAFYYSLNLKTISINKAETIGKFAFANCKNLKNISFPSVQNIGESAFQQIQYNGIVLTSVTLPQSLTTVGKNAFLNETKLKTINFLGSTDDWARINFENYSANPKYYAETLLMNGEEITEVNLSTGITEIKPYTFYRISTLKKVTLPDTVTNIGSNAFYYCRTLEKVFLPDSLQVLSENAFGSCNAIKELTLPCSVKVPASSYSNAFSDCKNIIKITLLKGTGTMTEFTAASKPWNSSKSSLTEVVFEDGISNIIDNAFNGYSNLEFVTLPTNSVTIGKDAFKDTKWIKNQYDNGLYIKDHALIGGEYAEGDVMIPDTVTEICDSAFAGNKTMTSLTIPESVKIVGDNAFANCSNLKELTIPCSLDIYKAGMFSGCTNLQKLTMTKGSGTMLDFSNKYSYTPWYLSAEKFTTLIIDDGVTNVSAYAFGYLSNLSDVSLPESVSSIGNFAFCQCKELKSIDLPKNLKSIGLSAFTNCTSLEKFIVPDSVETFGNTVLYNCTSLNELSVPCSLNITANSNNFKNCTNIAKITLTKGTGVMRNYYIDTATYTPWYISRANLEEIILEEGITNIGDYAFYSCKGITEIELPDTIVSIGERAFDACNTLTNINIPSSVKEIKKWAFRGCTGLTKLTIPETVETLGVVPFINCSGIKTLTLPSNFATTAFSGCANIETITITKGNGVIEGTYSSYQYSPCYVSRNTIKNVYLEEGIINLGNYAFYGCTGLTEIAIPHSVTSIGTNAFYGCTGLSSIVLPISVSSVESYAFRSCNNLEKIYFLNDSCSISPTYTIPATTTIIGYSNSTAQEYANQFSRDFVEIIKLCPDCGSPITNSVTVDSTCTEKGHTTLTCDNCGHTETTEIPEKGHALVTDDGKPATCTDTGLTPGLHCSDCGEVFKAQEIIPANGHTPVIDAAKAPTCTETGLTEGSHCSVCGAVIKAQEAVPATGHTPVIDAAKAPTCTETGLTEGSHCSVCGEVIKAQEVIPATGHTPVIDKAKAPTCTETGLTEGSHCSVCGEVIVAQETIPATGHKIAIDDAVPATCTHTGLTSGAHCSVCGEILVIQEVVPMAEHTISIDKAKTPTCTETGLTEGSHCSVCGEVIKAQEIISKTGHTPVIDEAKSPTCIKTGLTEGSHCSVCGEVIKAQEIIPATGHTEVIDEAEAPTCTETGLTEGSHCSVCGEVIIAQEIVPATGHSWNDGVVSTPATCHADGVKTYTCTKCGATKTEVIPKLEHIWNDGVITKQPTYTEKGEITYTCTLCGDTYTEEIPQLEKKGKLVVSNETVRAGDVVQVKLYLEENPGITALSMDVAFPDYFTLKDVQYTDLLSSKPTSSAMTRNPFTISWVSPNSSDVDNTGLFATLTFEVSLNTPVQDYPITVTYKSNNVFDAALINVPLDIDNGTVEVLKPTPGDVNRDGAINMKDLVLIQQLINHWDVDIVERAADVNDDGDIDMKDLVLLQRYINGWEVVLK